jgi:two-component system chemotaxis response regulator CheB
MPASAMQNVEVDHVAPLADIPALLVELANQPVDDPEPPQGGPEGEDMKEEIEHGQDREEAGIPSDLTCPACGGSLRESRVEEVVHFRCRTGHAYSPETLLAEQTDVIEEALWAAVRALEENAALARRMERRLGGRASHAIEARYSRRAAEAEQHAETLRRILMVEQREESGSGVV